MRNIKSVSYSSSFFKMYNPQQWQIIKHKGTQIWRNKQNGIYTQAYQIPKTATIQDLQKYQFRYLHGTYLVKIIDIVRYKQQNSYRKNQKTIVLIEYINNRLSNIKNLTIQEILYTLICIFKGCSLLNLFYNSFQLTQQMICINQQGKIKIWLNENLSCNSIQQQNNKKQQKQQKNSFKKKLTINMIIKKILYYLNKKLTKGYPTNFQNLFNNIQIFGDAALCVQNYREKNKYKVCQNINLNRLNKNQQWRIQNIKLKFENPNVMKYIKIKPQNKISIKTINKDRNYHLEDHRKLSQWNLVSPIRKQKYKQQERVQLTSPYKLKLRSPTPYPYDNNPRYSLMTYDRKYLQLNQQKYNQQQQRSKKQRINSPTITYEQRLKLITQPQTNLIKKQDNKKFKYQSKLKTENIFQQKYQFNQIIPQNMWKSDQVIFPKYQQNKQQQKISTFSKDPSKTSASIQTKFQLLSPKRNIQKKLDIWKQLAYARTTYQSQIENYYDQSQSKIKKQNNKIKQQQDKTIKKYPKLMQINTYDNPQLIRKNTQTSFNNTFMEKLDSFIDQSNYQQNQQFTPVKLLIDQQQINQNFPSDSQDYDNLSVLESSVDQVDNPNLLQNKLNRIKIDDLLMQRKRRQTQQLKKRVFNLKYNQDQGTVKDKTQNFKQQQNNLFKNLQFQQTVIWQHKPKIQIHFQQKQKVKQSHDTVCIKNIKDPYDIQAKYLKYVMKRQQIKNRQQIKDKQKQKYKSAPYQLIKNNHNNKSNTNINFNKNKQIPQIKQQKRQKITYAKLADFLYK